jgi:uncharacterized protein (TIGR02996 family)
MMQEGFLRDIVEHPEDDAPRLVYADWLDDQGEGGLAGFIRVQCRLAGLADDDVQRIPLEEEQARLERQIDQALLHGPRTGWLAGLPVWARRANRKFERGFIAGVSSATVPFLESGEQFVRATPLRELQVTNAAFAPGRLAASPALGRLASLNMSWSKLKGDGLAALLASPHLGNLRELNLTRCRLKAPDLRPLADAPDLAGLRVLRLSSNTTYDAGVEALAGSPHCANLTRLELSDSVIGPRGVAALARSPHMARLEALNLSKNNRVDDRAAEALASGRLERLAELDLMSTAVGLAGARALLTSTSLPALTHLSLNFPGDELWQVLPATHLRGRLALRLLSMAPSAGEALVDSPLLAACAKLEVNSGLILPAAAAPALAGLRSLTLRSSAFSARALSALLASPHLAALRRLALPYSVADDQVLAAVLDSPVAGRLTHLDLTDHRITPRGYARLESADLPRLVRLRLFSIFRSQADPIPRLRARFGARLVLGQ